MFKLEPNPSFWTKAEIHVPGVGPVSLEIQYRYLDKAARAAYFDTLAERTNIEALAAIVLDWRDIDAPFSPDHLARLLDDYPSATGALFKAYLAEITGSAKEPGAAEKN